MLGKASPLPALRPELRLIKGAPTACGAPSWLIHDPIQNKFIQIDITAYRMLSRWKPGASPVEFGQQLADTDSVHVDEKSIEEFTQFLYRNKLAADAPRDGWRYFAAEEKASRRSVFYRLLHHYLFLRIPLVRPQGFLAATLPIANLFASRGFSAFAALVGIAGLYLAARQWDAFLTTVPNIFTFEGMVVLAASIFVVKAAHELGHAYTAVRYGCHVPTMGVALMLMAPLLYTDVTDAWRLTDRRQRLRIDSAGIRVELVIAAVALFFWSFLPESTARGLAFNLCTVSLVSSLFINLNPLMRFDGYFILSEFLGVENLQQRAQALGVWKLREVLFAVGEPSPESLPRQRINLLVAYAFAVWIYRLLLFVGIALVIYHFFFKALGVLLFLFEIVYFVVRPIWNELKAWWTMRGRILRTRRTLLTMMLAVGGLGLFIVPWSTTVEIPAVVEVAVLQPIFPHRSAIVDAVHVAPGQMIAQGDPIATLSSPDVRQELELARTRLKLERTKFARRGSNDADREKSIVIESQIKSLETRISGLEREAAELVLRAPFKGKILELNPDLHPGRWIRGKDMVALVGQTDEQLVKGYVSESDLWRVQPGARGRFIPNSPQRAAFDVGITQISVSSAPTIDIEGLASVHSGPIAVTTGDRQRLVSISAQYLVHMNVDAAVIGPELSVSGIAHIKGRPEGLLARVWRQTLKVLMRETGA